MTTPKQVIMYETSDGLRFESEGAAEMWQQQLDQDPSLGVGVHQPRLTVDNMGYPEELPSDCEPLEEY